MYAELVCKVGRKHGSMSRGDLKFCTILIFFGFGFESNHLQTQSDLPFAYAVDF